jgi:pimeloyl-ACP methyl ester carboxylesterase
LQGVRCHHLEAGDGPPLVLLHGTAFDSADLSYGPSLPALAERHRVLALDWPGYGASEVPRNALSMDDHVDLLDAFLRRHGVDRAHVAGFSMGGAVALGYALQHADRVASLTMIGSYGLDARMPVPLVAYLAMRVPLLHRGVVWGLRHSKTLTRLVLAVLVFADRRLVTDTLIDEVHRQVSATEAERSFIAWLRGELRPFRLATSYADRLDGVDVPTLLLHGRRDWVVPWRKAESAHERLPNSRLAVVPRCGHWVMREAPEVFVDELLGFTASHRTRVGTIRPISRQNSAVEGPNGPPTSPNSSKNVHDLDE